MAQTVIGLFDSSAEAQQAVQQLVSKGFTRDAIDISTKSSSGTSGTSYAADSDDKESGIERFFKNLFGNDDHDSHDKYSRVAHQSDCIVTVHAQSADEAERAADILDDNGAINVDERASQSGYATTGNSFTGNQNESIDVIQEELEVGKREVKTGGVRLRSRVVEKPVEESLRLREERVQVTRNPVNREISSADLANFQDKDIEMVERAEVPVVNKQARVVEEVSLNKEVEERTETISDTVRHTEVDVEDLGTDRSQKSTGL